MNWLRKRHIKWRNLILGLLLGNIGGYGLAASITEVSPSGFLISIGILMFGWLVFDSSFNEGKMQKCG